jgi:hypothetical protein
MEGFWKPFQLLYGQIFLDLFLWKTNTDRIYVVLLGNIVHDKSNPWVTLDSMTPEIEGVILDGDT